jgi:hypothetical protein
VKKDATGKGDLDGVIATDKERERMDRDLTADEKSQLPIALRAVRGQYDQARAQQAAQHNARIAASLHSYSATLEGLEKILTRKGDIDGAIAVRKERAKLIESPAPLADPAAPKVSSSVPPPAEAPAAPETPKDGPASPVASENTRNLLKNGSFKEGMAGWESALYIKGSLAPNPKFSIDPGETHRGQPSVKLSNSETADAFCKQEVSVKPGRRYRFSAWIKTGKIVPEDGGAKLSAMGNAAMSKTVRSNQNWTQVSMEFDTGSKTTITVSARLGYNPNVTGTAWFSELSLIDLRASPGR